MKSLPTQPAHCRTTSNCKSASGEVIAALKLLVRRVRNSLDRPWNPFRHCIARAPVACVRSGTVGRGISSWLNYGERKLADVRLRSRKERQAAVKPLRRGLLCRLDFAAFLMWRFGYRWCGDSGFFASLSIAPPFHAKCLLQYRRCSSIAAAMTRNLRKTRRYRSSAVFA